MPVIDLFKRRVPKVGTSDADSDRPRNLQVAFENFSQDIHAIVEVSSQAEADQLANAAGSTSFPLFVYRTDIGTVEVKASKADSFWRHIGGSQHACEANVARTASPKTTTDLHVDSFDRMSEGWSVSAGKIVIPATGMYLVQAIGTIDGVKSDNPARRYIQYSVNGLTMQRWNMNGDTISGGVDLRYFTKGTVLSFQGYHELATSQVIRAEVQVVQTATPRWVNV